MRGKVSDSISAVVLYGITPAYAGKSASRFAKTALCWDHPRVCGEKPCCPPLPAVRIGSPPRMRGKASTHSTIASCTGITPAYAGKSIMDHVMEVRYWDHPRVCGEKLIVPRASDEYPGSPPRMRGKVQRSSMGFPVCGITPAYAGKSHRLVSRRRQSGDHPRVCGEKKPPCLPRHTTMGSPPRMRGKD